MQKTVSASDNTQLISYCGFYCRACPKFENKGENAFVEYMINNEWVTFKLNKK